jgi:hypothetical protein
VSAGHSGWFPPPAYLKVLPDAIPTELRALSQWVLWRAEWNGVRWVKRPYTPTGAVASTTNAVYWSPWSDVWRAYRTGAFAGVGLVLTPPLAGLDFDHCIHDGDITDGAIRDWLVRIDSYTELSPSGSGLHVLARATVPPLPGRKRDGWECYNSARYFTVTGHHWPGLPARVHLSSSAVREFHHSLAPDGLPPSAQPRGDHRRLQPVQPTGSWAVLGPRVQQHLASTGAAGYKSPSEADAAAAAALIASGRTAGEALALILMSPRGMAAYQRGHSKFDYWQRTVMRAAELVGPVTILPDGLRVRELRPAAGQEGAR